MISRGSTVRKNQWGMLSCFKTSVLNVVYTDSQWMNEWKNEGRILKKKVWGQVNHDFWASHALHQPRHSSLVTWHGFLTCWDEAKHGRIPDKIPCQSDALLIWSWRIGQLSQMISLTSILLTLMWHKGFTSWWPDLWMSRRCAQLDFGFVRGFGFGWDALWSFHEMDQKHYWFKRNHLYWLQTRF